MKILGIDYGGSGIKGAVVDTTKGELITDRLRLPTSDKLKPNDVAKLITELSQSFQWAGRIGLGFPAVIKNGISLSAANIHKKWIGLNVKDLLEEFTGCKVFVVNDADAAGLAEMTFGSGRDYQKELVLILTIGTGIGSAIFQNGNLLANSELGHLEIRGKVAEHRASDATRQKKDLSWKSWSKRFQEYLDEVEMLLNPDVIIIGGGVSKNHEKFFPLIKTSAKLLPAHFYNLAGIIGSAMFAAKGK